MDGGACACVEEDGRGGEINFSVLIPTLRAVESWSLAPGFHALHVHPIPLPLYSATLISYIILK